MTVVMGLNKLVTDLKQRAKKAKEDTSQRVIVGYTASYAIYVHENVEAHFKVGQAKFLEDAFKIYGGVARSIVIQAVKNGLKWTQALLLGGLRLQRESQLLCPVDTGNLKNSAFTRLE